MSSFTGKPEESWSLPAAVDALAAAARSAGRPGMIWLSALFYPSISFGLEAIYRLVEDGRISAPDLSMRLLSPLSDYEAAQSALPLLPILLAFAFSRCNVGLARISAPLSWNYYGGERGRPKLRHVWLAGHGLALPAFGMWVMLFLMATLALALILAPVLPLAGAAMSGELSGLGDALLLFLLMPVTTLLMLFAATLSVLHQLALHSLAHNRRGVVSALRHAWSMTRNNPWATARTVAVDLLLVVFVIAVSALIFVFFRSTFIFWLVYVPIHLFTGMARAGYWARAYRALGGLSPDDGVPGLAQQ